MIFEFFYFLSKFKKKLDVNKGRRSK